ncbi:MAG TPA: hypothetical protein ENN85_03005 [Methanoculleus sp.]|nr:hypothetical protein [Methanoculleus sp.]
MDYRSFLVLIIVALCFMCGCITAPAAESTLEGEGITDITLPAEVYRVTLGYALDDLAFAQSEGFLPAENMAIHQINGAGVELDGTATVWILGATTRDNATALLVYDAYAWKAYSWPEQFGTPAIDMDAIMSPEDLFAAQGETMQELLEISEATEISLELIDGVYRVYARNGARMSDLSFDAESGELILSE